MHTPILSLSMFLTFCLDAIGESEARLLYVHVTLEWSERPTSTRGKARAKKQQESKLVPRAVDVLHTSRVAFIPIALGAHGYEDTYIAGVASGPAMRISWSGSA